MEAEKPKLKISYVNAGSHSHIVGLDELAGEIERILARGADPRKITVTVVAEKKGFEIYCPKCGETRTSKISPSRYATKDGDRWKYDCKACKDIERKIGRRKVVEPKHCRHCGETFQPKRSNGLYCSDRCKTAYGRRMAVLRDFVEFYLKDKNIHPKKKNLTDEEVLAKWKEIQKSEGGNEFRDVAKALRKKNRSKN